MVDVPWNDDFAAARNAVLAAATSDWLLHMDADETLDEDGAQAIRDLVDADGDGADAIEVMLANYCDDMRAWLWRPVSPDDPNARGKLGFIAVPLLRLFRNRRQVSEYREPCTRTLRRALSNLMASFAPNMKSWFTITASAKAGTQKQKFDAHCARESRIAAE